MNTITMINKDTGEKKELTSEQLSQFMSHMAAQIKAQEEMIADLKKKIPEWQPIETAPKDERILLSDGDIQFCGRWISDSEIEDMMLDDDLDEGWYEENLFHDGYERYFLGCTPKHWMPLPKAPEGE